MCICTLLSMRRKMSTVLFDMDGTLTPARRKIQPEMVDTLASLLQKANKIGIVTGSGYDYIVEQCSDLWKEDSGINPNRLTLFPCNGTQYYMWENGGWQKIFSASMEDELGENFRSLIQILLRLQSDFAQKEENGDVPLIGHFISYRDSMLNWCPLGRDATFSYRKDFIAKDKERDIRKNLHEALYRAMEEHGINNVTAALGGNTSIDIYPTGWDKSFALQHVVTGREPWFVGDRCEPGGNDHAIYDRLIKKNRAFSTTGPEQTIEIINKKIIPYI